MQRIPPAPPENYPPGHVGRNSMMSGVMMQAPSASIPYSGFIRAVFAELSLEPRDRELVTLLVIHMEQGEFEWAQHEYIAPNVLGVPVEQVDAIAADQIDSDVFSEREQAILAFTKQVVENVRVDDECFAAVSRFLSHREIIEVIFTLGNYMLLCRISEVSRIPPESPEVGMAALKGAVDNATR